MSPHSAPCWAVPWREWGIEQTGKCYPRYGQLEEVLWLMGCSSYVDGRFGLVSTNYTLITWWNPVYNANIWRSIEKQQMTSSLRSHKAVTSNQRDLSCCHYCSRSDCVMWPLVLRTHYHVMNIHQFVKMRKYEKLRPYFKICSDKWKHSILTTHCVILVSIRCVFAEPIAKVDIPTTDRPSG